MVVQTLVVVAGFERGVPEVVQSFAYFTWYVGFLAELQSALIVGKRVAGLAFGEID